MSLFSIWTIVGWSILGLIVLGIGGLVFAMWKDAKAKESRDIAAPSLGPGPTESSGSLFSEKDKKSPSASAAPSRRFLRNSRSAPVVMEDSSQGSLWADDEDGFNLTAGRD